MNCFGTFCRKAPLALEILFGLRITPEHWNVMKVLDSVIFAAGPGEAASSMGVAWHGLV